MPPPCQPINGIYNYSEGEVMKRLLLVMTPELLAAIDRARGDRPRTEAIECWLWRVREVKASAKELGIVRPERRKPGRPRKDRG